jgi:hypothetical protein
MIWQFIRNVLLALAIYPAASRCAMSDLFTIDSSCNGIDIDTVFNDAITLLASAQAAVDTVKSARNFNKITNSKARQAMKNARHMFGIKDYSPLDTSGLNGNDRDSMDTVGSMCRLIPSCLPWLISLTKLGSNHPSLDRSSGGQRYNSAGHTSNL